MTDRQAANESRAENYWPLLLLFLVGVLNLFDRQIINVLAQDIKMELRISDTELGMLTGTAFGVFYALMGIPLGWLGDRFNRVNLIAISLLLWSAMTLVCGMAGGFFQLFVARMGVGVGEAGSQPASTALIPDLFPESRRTSVMALMLVGAPVGSFLGLLVGGSVGFHWGWRAAFLVAGIPGLLVASLMLATMRDPGRQAEQAGPPLKLSMLTSLFILLRRPGYLWLVIGMTCSVFLVYATGAWLPAFFIRVHGMNTAQIGGFAAVAVGGGGIIGALAAGFICDRFRHYAHDIESIVSIVVLALCVPSLLATVLLSNIKLALASMFVLNIFVFAFLGPIVRLMQKAATLETRALSIAFASTVTSLTGLTVGLPLVGAISDALAPRYGSMSIGYAIACCALAGVIGAYAHWCARQVVATAI